MKLLRAILLLLATLGAPAAHACATCYGASDSPLAQGMNWGIMVLLVSIFCVLTVVTSFFVYIVRRAKAVSVSPTAPVSTDSKS